MGPAILDQPRTLALGVDLGATGLDKYGVCGPRVGLLGGRSDLVAAARARAFELGSECRPVLYPAVEKMSLRLPSAAGPGPGRLYALWSAVDCWSGSGTGWRRPRSSPDCPETGSWLNRYTYRRRPRSSR